MVGRCESHALDSTSNLEQPGSFGDFLHDGRDAPIAVCTNFCEPGTAYLPASGVFVSGTLGTQSPFLGSVLTGKPTGTVRPLSLGDALDRGLKYNLGLIESDLSTRTARAERLKTLSELPLTSTTSGCWESPR